MSDKQTPKTFEDFLKTTEYECSNCAEVWNAATEATRTEYDDKIKAMQAEIDKINKKDKLTKEREVRMTEHLACAMAVLKTLNDSTEWTDKQKQVLQGFKEGETLLNQRGEDER